MLEEVIVNGIIEALLQTEKPLSYTNLYKTLIEYLGRNLSHRDFSNALKFMEEEKILVKDDNTGKRGFKVDYSLTEQSKNEHQLKILGIGEEFERRRSIYLLLLYFDVFKRSKLLTKIQLFNLFKKIGIDNTFINNSDNTQEENIQDAHNLLSDYFGVKTHLIGKPKEVEVVEYVERVDESSKKNIRYYVVIPGFTIEEFVSYINKLRKLQDPRPFSKYFPLIPYVYYSSYSKKELIESVDLFHKAGLIKLTNPVFHGEIRYKITEDRLLGIFPLIRLIYECHFQRIIGKIYHIEKPDNEDKNFLTFFFGEKVSESFITSAHEPRKAFKKNQNDEEIKKIKAKMKKLEDFQDGIRQELFKKYGDILRTNGLVQGLVIGQQP